MYKVGGPVNWVNDESWAGGELVAWFVRLLTHESAQEVVREDTSAVDTIT